MGRSSTGKLCRCSPARALPTHRCVAGLCAKAQRKLARTIKRARQFGRSAGSMHAACAGANGLMGVSCRNNALFERRAALLQGLRHPLLQVMVVQGRATN